MPPAFSTSSATASAEKSLPTASNTSPTFAPARGSSRRGAEIAEANSITHPPRYPRLCENLLSVRHKTYHRPILFHRRATLLPLLILRSTSRLSLAYSAPAHSITATALVSPRE